MNLIQIYSDKRQTQFLGDSIYQVYHFTETSRPLKFVYWFIVTSLEWQPVAIHIKERDGCRIMTFQPLRYI